MRRSIGVDCNGMGAGEEMTSQERFQRMFEHRDADRIPIIDSPWLSTIERWREEGMPEDVNIADYFGLDHVACFELDNTPRYPVTTLEETEEYKITTTAWGVTYKNWKHAASTPEYVGFTVTDPDKWCEARERMVPSRDRIPWEYLKTNYAKWREDGYWIQMGMAFGFDCTHAHVVGTERLLEALVEKPEWCVDMFNHELDVYLALADMVWDAGYRFDSIFWCDDMGYKQNQFFSMRMYRELLKPVHQRAIDWAHARGIKAHLHSCGDVNPFVPEFIDMGLDALNPLEVKAGMNPVELKKTYGDKLVFHGGINAVLWDHIDAIEAEMRRVVPAMKESGGYIFSSDHSVPSSVSLESFRRTIELARELGSLQ